MSKSDVIALGLRMVVPVRHEFGRSIRVDKLFDDKEYAQTVIELVSRSANEQLRAQGAYLAAMILGPRSQPAPMVSHEAETSSEEASEQAEREAALNRYRRGLR